MPLYKEQSLLFIHVWKTGGTSLSSYLEKSFGLKDEFKESPGLSRFVKKMKYRMGVPALSKHSYAIDIKNKIGPKKFDELYKVAFVRNPYDWLVSWYSFVTETTVSPDTGRPWRHHMFDTVNGMNFKEFINWVVLEDGLANVSSRKNSKLSGKTPFLQKDWVTNENGEVCVDFIGKYESLDADSLIVCNKINIDFKGLPKVNVSNRKKPYLEYYDDETKRLVGEYFKEDFEAFGYEQ